MRQRVYLPERMALDGRVVGNRVQQLDRHELHGEAEVAPWRYGGHTGHVVTWDDGRSALVVPRRMEAPPEASEVLLVPGGVLPSSAAELRALPQSVRWLRPGAANPTGGDPAERAERCAHALESWRDRFSFREEVREGSDVLSPGLRPPQIGALHAVLAHWSVTDEPATIVMPTGTGKTETMLGLLACHCLPRVLVVVPTSALREQIARKFTGLGVLGTCGVLAPGISYPVVGTLEHRLRSPQAVEEYFGCCNVIVTTMSVVSGCSNDVKAEMARMCSHLFIDEAHHVSAPSWEEFRRFFLDRSAAFRPIVQFTATPFRNDGKSVDGKVVYCYPLRKAQQEGYFRQIDFRPIREYRQTVADQAIARAAVAQLERDLAGGLDHIVMARTASISRARHVHRVYEQCANLHTPVLVHSEMGVTARQDALHQLRARGSRVIVCVDMLGEGFDLPELKIAALHDMHKSLAITLQFTGRFTRTQRNIGDATVIANLANAEVERSLRDLYAEDADWNYLLRHLSEGATGREIQRSEFLAQFRNVPAALALQNVLPKMSTVVYRTKCRDWRPHAVEDVVDERHLFTPPVVNYARRVALFVTQEVEPVTWGNVRGIHNTVYDLYLLHWNREQGLLYIHSSNKDSLYQDLARAVAGENVELVHGEIVFRALHGISRLILMNLGLSHSLSRAVRFTMYVGSDVREGLSEASLQNKYKSNLFGRGYENGDRASMGCSYRGRLWSHRIADSISEWIEWCDQTGAKLLNERISVRDILSHVIIPKQVQERPELVPLTIEWSEYFLSHSDDSILLDVAGDTAPFYDVGLELAEHSAQGPLRFRVFTERRSVEYEIRFTENGVRYVPAGVASAAIEISRRRKSLSEWFDAEPPVVRFEDGAFLIYNDLFEASTVDRVPFDRERIEAWDWTGTDIRVESQTPAKLPHSIQRRVIRQLLDSEAGASYDIVFDDDDSNEAADVLAIRVEDERLVVHLYHCKYSGEDQPGARVVDLYAVCGQAQRSVYRKGDVHGLLRHMLHRENSRLERHHVSRFEHGDLAVLDAITRQSPLLAPEFRVFVVQPGLSRAGAAQSQLDLLAATELYLQETFAIRLGVIASP